MERVVFIVEETNERIPCMLNPENLSVERCAGVRSVASLGGVLSSGEKKDDPVLWHGGGRTRIKLNLLFDVGLLAENRTVEDVRELTSPLQTLSESRNSRNAGKLPPLVRFIWGKAWNIRCIVDAVAERFERFTSSGTPRRSWMSISLLRLDSGGAQEKESPAPKLPLELHTVDSAGPLANLPVHEVIGSGSLYAGRLDIVAEQHYGNPAHWRTIAAFNDVTDPLHVPVGARLRLPPESVGGRG